MIDAEKIHEIKEKVMRHATLHGKVPRTVAVLAFMAMVLGIAWIFYPNKYQPRTIQNEAAAQALVSSTAQAPQNYLSLITEPDDGTGAIQSSIDGAKKSIDLAIYELQDQEIERALADAQSRGVAVRVVLQNIKNYGRQPNQPAYEFLQQHGVPVKWAGSRFYLTHEKMLAIDGVSATIMTFNLQPQYYKTSRDFGVIDAGVADVAAIESAFNADWNGSQTQANPATDLVWSPGSAADLLALIHYAQSSLDIYNEEMADPRIISAIEQAAARGVAVHVDMTYQTAWKPAFSDLVSHAVMVRTRPNSKKFYIHAKAIIADGKLAFVGSENFSEPSLDSNRELGIIISKPQIVSSLEQTFTGDWAASRPFAVK